MWIQATLSKADLAGVTEKLCPLRIRIGEDGFVVLSEPRDLELAADVGLRMTVTLEIHWPVLGIQLPVSVRSATLHVRPEIGKTPKGEALTFKLRLDDVDVSILPAFVDRKIVDMVNAELEAKHIQLSWGFTETLSHLFELPDALLSAGALDLHATAGRVKIAGEAVAFAVLFEARVESRPAGGKVPLPRVAPPPLPLPPSHPTRGLGGWVGRYPVGVGAICGALLGMGALALVRATRRPGTLW
jgi:hypothetical protein